ncbi:methyltransferase domain-containing protein [Aspergillus floccosus]
MPRPQTLPLAEEWTDPDVYVDALLSFATSSDLFRHLCGGVHILDFLTREPDLYDSLLPAEWRTFFEKHDVQDILDLLLREDIAPLLQRKQGEGEAGQNEGPTWRDAPTSLLEYIQQIRRFSLKRDFHPLGQKTPTIPRHIATGMNVKKYHEVAHFSRYVDELCKTVDEQRGEAITHVVDFGSGQSYLGRTLASPPYNRHIVAIERTHQFINGAKGMDILAKLTEKKVVNMYNKRALTGRIRPKNLPNAPAETETPQESTEEPQNNQPPEGQADGEDLAMINVFRDISLMPGEIGEARHYNTKKEKPAEEDDANKPRGAMDYIEHEIKDGYLEPIIGDVIQSAPTVPEENSLAKKQEDARVMVVSLHSCGNLLHHGVRSLTLNPSVKAIAMIGCCYNLVTERLGPATWKLPIMRTSHPRLTRDAIAYDPHGFPMSKRMEDFEHDSGKGMRINITARSMSLQAPYNWDRESSENFFTRHFYRTLLQRMLMDRGVIQKPSIPTDLYSADSTTSDKAENALVVGSLRKTAFVSFPAYARAAVVKLGRDPVFGETVKAKMADLDDEELDRYVAKYWHRKKHLSVLWSLMSFSASIIEAIIVVDRWQFLREHEDIKDCWVEPVFDYSESPRNLAVIGVKK